MLIKFYTLEDDGALEREPQAGATLVKIVNTGDTEYNPYEFSDCYYLESEYCGEYAAI